MQKASQHFPAADYRRPDIQQGYYHIKLQFMWSKPLGHLPASNTQELFQCATLGEKTHFQWPDTLINGFQKENSWNFTVPPPPFLYGAKSCNCTYPNKNIQLVGLQACRLRARVETLNDEPEMKCQAR